MRISSRRTMAPRGRRSWIAHVAAGLAACGVAAGASLQAQATSLRTFTWTDAIREHLPGKLDPPLVAASGLRMDRADDAIRRIGSSDVPQLTRALVLLTDIAIVERAKPDQARNAGSGSFVIVDGRLVGRRTHDPRWAVARRLATRLLSDAPPDGQQAGRLWYRAVATLFQSWGDITAVHMHLNAGLDLLPDDAVLYTLRGTVRQTYADRRTQRFLRGAVDSPGRFVPGGTGYELGLAEADFRRAIALDASLVEARIRLAHVLSDRRRPEEAARLAGAALAESLPAFLEFYAALVLGRCKQDLGDLAAARAAYERAAARAPDAQSPRLGLSRVALAEEGPRAALALLTGPNALAPARDPWWFCFRRHEPDADTLLKTLRELVR